MTAKLSTQGILCDLWNIYDGPVRVAIVEEHHLPAGTADPIQVTRGYCDHEVAVRLIQGAKDKQSKRVPLKGGIF